MNLLDDAETSGYEDFTDQIVKGDNVTTLHVTGFRDGNTVTILGIWLGAFTSTNDTILFFPQKYSPKRQIYGCGTVEASDNATYTGWYWASGETHRIGQGQTSTARGGSFIITWPIAGRGKAEYGASAVRSGVITVNGDGSSDFITVNVTFSTPMPDKDYLVLINPNTASWEKTQWRTLDYTANGFRFDVTTVDDSAFLNAKYNYTAIKLYTDNEYNTLLTLPETKLDKSVVDIDFGSCQCNACYAKKIPFVFTDWRKTRFD